MKRFILALLLLGCAGKVDVNKELKESEEYKKLIDNYNISKDSLVKLKNHYYFTYPDIGGIKINRLDSNYNLDKVLLIKGNMSENILVADKNLYLLTYDEDKNRPLLITLDENLNVLNKKYVGKKFDLPRDFNNNALLLLTYNPSIGARVIIDQKEIMLSHKDAKILPKFIRKFNDGYLVVGSIAHPQEDLYLAFIKNGKVVWERVYDFGLEDNAKKIDNNTILVISQDYMGAEREFEIKIDKNGEIKEIKKGIEFKKLPLKYRT